MDIRHRFLSSAALLSAASLALVGCSAANNSSSNESSPAASTSASAEAAPIKEGSTLSSRIALTYDGGVMTVDARKMELINTVEKEGFLRLNPAGDNRHMTIADGSSYSVMDMGVWEQPHGDHNHIYTTEPTLSQLTFDADHTGHVINDFGRTAMFADGTGSFEIFDPLKLTGEDSHTATELETSSVNLPEPHHGFAIPLENDEYLVAVGNEDERSGAAVVDAEGKTVTENDQCPGIHGEAIAADGAITIGCENGTLIYQNGEFTKVDSEEDYARLGNQAGDPDSPVVLADYKTDKDAELERPEQFSLIDTAQKSIQKVQLPEGVSYTFRSLARGPEGEALLLTTDGKLRFYDQNTGEELGNIDLMDQWEESEVWQEPRPAIWVDDDVAYVTDPSQKKLIGVSLKNIASDEAEVFGELDLPETPNEINGVTGKAPEGAEESHTDH
ncbi:hypothetical protein [Rothia aerolata]|uniref:Secreted protein n=1 Tax=Rothia aerolata TaxID=1812262 RepID=A0A917IU66_9MICC|nr:hypothetical protein [Rothia aerolata]GGH62623.1 hypothetical protein GCM10007359_13050 [Rothia aerolata]